ncbi:PIF1 family DEAD/DEAH box helicase [Alloscardovia criceti]|uniref:PIF1 family DEAD/DEAH box helicase n=1 Tax=Alloscardovia criceti TaxID=356828 RepID=UPI000371AAF1|nr:PIF1 family DEAD/DEAH box helicase [Alloscardovia criceti]
MLQSQALEILSSGASVYLTGAPGAGKTYVLNEFIQQARKKGKTVAVTASTGIASTHINGQTIHSYSGVGVFTYLNEQRMKNILMRRKKALVKTDILVIDEVSMIHAWLFDLVDEICRRARKNNLPFGGMQVVLSGDFFQLPPVSVSSRNSDLLGLSEETLRMHARYAAQGKNMEGFITESFAWEALQPIACYLTEQHRQDDGQLLSVLTSIRHGEVSQNDFNVIASRMGVQPNNTEVVTHLFPTNAQADALNRKRLALIDNVEHNFEASAVGNKQLVERLKKSMLAPENLVLKVGASVMAVRNDTDKQFVNGSLGRVVSFTAENKGGWPIVEFDNGNTVTMEPQRWEITDADVVLAAVTQVPLRCAWGITIHKSQGMTLDRAVMDLSRTFASGMGYVAMSRVQGLEGLYLTGLNEKAFLVSPLAVSLDGQLRIESATTARILEKDGLPSVLEAVQLQEMGADGVDDEFAQGALF